MKYFSLSILMLVAGAANLVAQTDATTLKAYKTYDFVAGDKILFADDFSTDKEGAMPSHWKLEDGKGAIVVHEGEKAFLPAVYYTRITPAMKAPTYLPANYTIEFDTYLDRGYDGNPGFLLHLRVGTEVLATLDYNHHNFRFNCPSGPVSGDLPTAIADENFDNQWHHIALAVKGNQAIVYVDQFRIVDIPDANLKATNVMMEGNASGEMPMMFKNFKLAEGSNVNLFSSLATDGKFITRGILFDVNKSTIKPESMGVLNEIAKYMKENATIKFEVDGHTDSDGDEAANLKLSQARADAVKKTLEDLGIDGTRLTTKGFGESVPVAPNTTAEGRASNRRVEFVKK